MTTSNVIKHSDAAEKVLQSMLVDYQPTDVVRVAPNTTGFTTPMYTVFRNDKPVHHFSDLADAEAVRDSYMAKYMLRWEDFEERLFREYRFGVGYHAVAADAHDFADTFCVPVEIYLHESGDCYESIEIVMPE